MEQFNTVYKKISASFTQTAKVNAQLEEFMDKTISKLAVSVTQSDLQKLQSLVVNEYVPMKRYREIES